MTAASRVQRFNLLFGLWIVLLSAAGADAQEDRTTPQFRARISGLFPGARPDLDAAIQRAGSYDFDAASEALNADQDAYNDVFTASSQNNILPTGMCYFWGILSDRRIGRLFELLGQMGPEQAAKRASTLFDEKLKIHVAGWTDGFAERAAGRVKPVPIERNTQALRSALFFVAWYCDSPTFLKKVDDWQLAMTPAGVQTLIHPRLIPLRSYLLTQGLPDNLFLANMMLVALHRSGKLTPERLAAARELGLPQVAMRPLVAWNAHTSPFDWIAIKGGVRYDAEWVLVETPVTITYWENRPFQSLDVQEGIVEYLRVELGGQVAKNAEPQPTPADTPNGPP